MSKHILALDPANLTGFAHSNGESGTWLLTTAVDTHPGQRLMRFEAHLRRVIVEWGCDVLAAEDASFGSHNPAVQAQHNELKGVILKVTAELVPNAVLKFFGPTTIKVFATGNGHAKKPAMIKAYERHHGYRPKDDNECDALWILKLYSRPDCWAKKSAKPKKQRVLKRAKKKGPDMLFAK